MKVLSLSDTLIPFIYSPQVKNRFRGVELVLGCGDLSYYYLEYVFNALDAPLLYVRGNHDKSTEYGSAGPRTYPHGCIDLHRRVIRTNGLLLAGVEGSLRYREGDFQYTQLEMWGHVLSLVPALWIQRMRFGRKLDIFLSHSPPAGIHDCEDLPHKGIRAFRWLIDFFQPSFFIHGHIHIHRPDTLTETIQGRTRVINSYGFREFTIDPVNRHPG